MPCREQQQFADALQQTIQMGIDAQAQEIKNARLDKQFDKVKVFDGSKPSECHPWLEEVHALCIQTGRPFHKMLLLCAGQAVHDFITDMSPDATDDQIKNDLITGYSDLQGLGCKQAAYNNITQKPDEPLRSYIVRYSRLFKLLNGTAPNDVKMRMTSMHFVNSLHSYLSSKVENRILSMNERNYSLGDTFKVALECELKAIASERWHNKRNAAMTNQVEVIQPQTPLQPKEISEVHVRNPNYKGKNYDPNFQAKRAEAAHTASHNNKQPQQASTMGNHYKPAYNKPASMYNNSNSNAPLTSSSDIVGEVTLKTSVDGYQLLKVNEMIKNAVAWRARMPKTSKFSKYFDNNSKEGTPGMPEPKVHIMKPRSRLWAKLPRILGTQNRNLLKLWKCTSTLATKTWRMSQSPTHKTVYQSNTDLMTTTKMYIALKNISGLVLCQTLYYLLDAFHLKFSKVEDKRKEKFLLQVSVTIQKFKIQSHYFNVSSNIIK